MKALLGRYRVSLGLALLFAVVGGFFGPLAGPGYELCLVAGVVLPSLVAVAVALRLVSQAARPRRAVAEGAIVGLLHAFLVLAVSWAHGARAGFCDPVGGTLYFAMTTGVGTVLAGVVGAYAGRLARRQRRRKTIAVLISLSLPWGGILVSVYRFWSAPMIFAFDPFVGFFSGTLYDTIIETGAPLVTHRLLSLSLLCALVLLAPVLLCAPAQRRRAVAVFATETVLGAAFALAALLGYAFGERLGHRSTGASIAKDLGAELSGPRCRVVLPSTVAVAEAKLMLRDCEEQLAQVESNMGVKGPERVTAYFFRDAEDKRRLMGAAHTYIAKPWREEVYLQMATYPHPVLGHELAHVVAGRIGRGPFRVAGDYGGILPNPGLIEGIAVAAAPDDDEVSPLVLCRAMMELGLLPKLGRLFGLGFLAESSQRSYTVAGAFVRFVGDRYGKAAVSAWYGGASVQAATGKPLAALEAEFHDELRRAPIDDRLLTYAKGRFSRPGVLQRRCPHVVDELRRDGDKCRDTGRHDEALGLYDKALRLDPTDDFARLSRAVLLRRVRDESGAELMAFAHEERVPMPLRDRALEALADADFQDGRLAEAAARYELLRDRAFEEDPARTFEVKALAARSASLAEGVRLLLLGDKNRAPDNFAAAVALAGVQGAPDSAWLVHYLLGRNLAVRNDCGRALPHFDKVWSQAGVTPRVARETLRLEVVCACAQGVGVSEVKARFEQKRSELYREGSGKRQALSALLARCTPTPP